MSHFSAMACRFSRVEQIIKTLEAMGVPTREIMVHSSLGTFAGTSVLPELRSTSSSQWNSYARSLGYKDSEPCPLIVSEAGMKALATAAEKASNLGTTEYQRAELGFYDCGCDEAQPQYVMATDPHESGRWFAGYFAAAYQAVGIQQNDGLEISQITQAEDGTFTFQIRKPQRGGLIRGAARAARTLVGRGR